MKTKFLSTLTLFSLIFLLVAPVSTQELGRPISAADYAPLLSIFIRRLEQPLQYRAFFFYDAIWYNNLVVHSENGLLINGSEPSFRRASLPEQSIGFAVSSIAVSVTLGIFGEEDARAVQDVAAQQLFLDLPLRAEDVPEDHPARGDLLVGFALAEEFQSGQANNGFNEDGTDDGSTINLIPFEDITGYEPINTPKTIKDLRRWTPLIESPRPQSIGAYNVQLAITPQAAFVNTTVLSNEFAASQRVPSPYPDEILRGATCAPDQVNLQSMQVQRICQDTEEALSALAGLTEEQKILSEYFDDPVSSLTLNVPRLAAAANVSFRDSFIILILLNGGMYETTLLTWREKRRHDAVRPTTLIQQLYNEVDIENGANVAAQGQDFASFLRTPPRQEYPSLHAAQCQYYADAAEIVLGLSELNIDVVIEQGSSDIAPSQLPSSNFTIEIRDLQRDIASACSESRIWSGTNLRPAVERGRELGSRIANEYVNRLSCLLPDNDLLPPCRQ